VTTEDTIQHLNDLTKTCKDGELGYRAAAANVKNTQLESMFLDYAEQRGHFVKALQAEVERLGGASTDSGTPTATVFRGWINLKSELTGGDGGAIIAACETGEEAAVGAYALSADLDLTGQTKTLVDKQRLQVKEALAHMLRLKAEAGNAHFQQND